MIDPSVRWDYEKLFFSGDEYFTAVTEAIRSAKTSVSMETFIFEDDEIGSMILGELAQAQERGVHVRLLVDGVGSFNWLAVAKTQGFTWVRAHHPLRWRFTTLRFWRRLNRRLHRKQVIIDSERAFVGSYNVSASHSEKYCATPPCWQDVAVEVRGPGVQGLETVLLQTWRKAATLSFRLPGRWLSRSRFRTRRRRTGALTLFRANDTLRQRIYCRRDILKRLESARHRIWIANPYFLPQRRMLTALLDVPSWIRELKIIVPLTSDVTIVRLATMTLFDQLCRRGIQILEFHPTFFHGKVMIVDDWMTVGSTNLNHRSFLHDYELDIILTHPESREELVHRWHQWLRDSTPVDQSRIKSLTWIERVFGRFFVIFKWWM